LIQYRFGVICFLLNLDSRTFTLWQLVTNILIPRYWFDEEAL